MKLPVGEGETLQRQAAVLGRSGEVEVREPPQDPLFTPTEEILQESLLSHEKAADILCPLLDRLPDKHSLDDRVGKACLEEFATVWSLAICCGAVARLLPSEDGSAFLMLLPYSTK